MTNILICPIQCQVHGTVIDERPNFLLPKPSEDDHALLVHDPDGCSPPLIILLLLDSITNYFEVRCPSLVDYEYKTIPKYHLMFEGPPWSSYKDGMINHRGHIITKCSTDPHGPDMNMSSVVSAANMAIYIDQHVKVDMKTAVQISRLMNTQQKLTVDSNMLDWCQGISLPKAQRAVQCIT